MKSACFTSLFILFFSFLSAQNESNIWYFGHNCGLDFNSGSPVALLNGATDQREGVASISDSTGAIMFYTDGVTVWNRNHQAMLNGVGLNGHFSATQSATIVPMPGSTNEYYIFTCGDFTANPDFCYSVVDMTLDSGNGDVTAKNIQLGTAWSEKCVAVNISGSSNYWVITHDNGNLFYAYLVDSSGINTPVTTMDGPLANDFELGHLKVSPDGTKIAAGLYSSVRSLAMYNFDCVTGVLTNELIFPPTGTYGIFGLEFSPDGTKLYVIPWNSGPSIPSYVIQMDITLASMSAIWSSRDTIGLINDWAVGAAQLGPDQKIYISRSNGDSLSVINSPNLAGTACDFVENGVGLGGNLSELGLPALINYSYCQGPNTINEYAILMQTQIFPNPVSEEFKITGLKTDVSLNIYSVLGDLVFSSILSPVNNKVKTDIFSKGIYFVEIIYDGVSVSYSKIIVR